MCGSNGSRSYLKQIYVYMCTNKLYFRLFADYKLLIKGIQITHKSILILGGNNRIRIIDFDRNLTYEILKNGFSNRCIINEIKAREYCDNCNIPVITNISHDYLWYESSFINSVSIDRINNKKKQVYYQHIALERLYECLGNSVEYISVEEYMNSMLNKIDDLLSNKSYTEQIDNKVKGVVNLLYCFTRKLGLFHATMIKTVNTHGDFQRGNILVDCKGIVSIVDWEHLERRQILYDYLVITLRSRPPIKFSKNAFEFIDDSPELFAEKIYGQDSNELQSKEYRLLLLCVFLMEELLWGVCENYNPCLEGFGGSLPIMITEVHTIINNRSLLV